MPNPSRLTTAMIMIISAGFTLTAILFVLTTPQDRPFILLLGILDALLTCILWYLLRHVRRKVPAGKAAIVKSLGQQKTVTGPTNVSLIPVIDQITIHDLRQKPIDFTIESTSADNLTIRISLTIFWDAQPESLAAIVASKLNMVEVFKRYVEAKATTELSRLAADDARQSAGHIAERMEDYLNQPENCEKTYLVKRVLVTQMRLPSELTVAATRLRELQIEREIARTKREIDYDNRVSQAQARAQEMSVLNPSITQAAPRTVEHVENIAGITKTKPEV